MTTGTPAYVRIGAADVVIDNNQDKIVYTEKESRGSLHAVP